MVCSVRWSVVCGVFFSVEKIDDKELFMTNEDPPFDFFNPNPAVGNLYFRKCIEEI